MKTNKPQKTENYIKMGTAAVNTSDNAFMKNPLFKAPFALGWKRELVIRRVNVSKTKLSGDVYYYTPTKKKLRSKKEVQKWLNEHFENRLTMANFTFQKMLTNLNDPNREIKRMARKCNPRVKASKKQNVEPLIINIILCIH